MAVDEGMKEVGKFGSDAKCLIEYAIREASRSKEGVVRRLRNWDSWVPCPAEFVVVSEVRDPGFHSLEERLAAVERGLRHHVRSPVVLAHGP